MPSSDYEDFVRSVEGPIVGRSGLSSFDLGALAALEDDERMAAILLLGDRLAKGVDDPRVPDALRSVGAAGVPMLEAALGTYGANATKVEIARALWDLDARPEALDALLDLLGKDADPELRKRAADRLRDLEGEEARVDAALIQSIALDSDEDVRLFSELVLFDRLGLEQAKDTDPCRASTIPGLLYSSLSTVRSEGIRLLLDLSRVVRSGGDPAAASFEGNDLSAVERFDDSWRTSIDERPDYDLDALRSFVGDAVPWAEDRLLRDLDADPRGARALAVVGSARAIPCLREAAAQEDPDLAREAAAALKALA